MSGYFVETTMLYGALGGAAVNLVTVSVFGSFAGAVMLAGIGFAAVALELLSGKWPNR